MLLKQTKVQKNQKASQFSDLIYLNNKKTIMQNNITFKNFAGFIKLICLVLCMVSLGGTLNAQTVSSTGGTGYAGNYGINPATNPGTQSVSFVVENTTAAALALTTVNAQLNSYFGVAPNSPVTTKLYYSSTSLSGPYDLSNAAWIQVATGNATSPAITTGPVVTPVITGINFVIPAATQYRFVLETSGSLAFSYTPTPTPNFFTVGGVTLKTGNNLIAGSNVGYIAVNGNSGTANTPMFFGGSVVLTNSIPCSGTPAPGNTISTVPTACAGTPFTLSAQNPTAGSGVTYQWQSAPTTAGPFVNITGATGATYTTTLTAATAYQVVVTCSGNSGTSTPLSVGLTPASGCYCTAGATSTSFEKIANVKFGTIDNSSTGTAGYENFLAQSTNATQGASMPITITGNADAYDFDHVIVWIDFNKNGSFNDPGERVFVSAESAGPWTSNITIPLTATVGSTRMRIRLEDNFFGPNGTSCGTSTYGQVEDYTVNIVPCIAATIASQPSAATTNCGGTATFTAGTAGSVSTIQWQYRKNATSDWVLLSNGPLVSGVNTGTLTVLNAIDTLNGYQFQAIVTGICTGIIFSTPATLTVNRLQPVISPATATICVGSVQQLTLTNTTGNVDLLKENFDNVLPTGWAQQNRSLPLGVATWFQGNPAAFPSHSGADNSYIGSNFQATTTVGTISNWLFTPVLNIKNGDVITFWTRIPDNTPDPEYPDRLEVRISGSGNSTNVGATATSTGDFATLLLSVNPTLTTGVYPKTWTQFTATVSGLAGPTTGRVAFRHFVTNGGSAASNSDYIGLDDFVYTSTGGPAQGVWTSTHPNTIFTNVGATTPYVAGTLATTVYVKPDSTRTYSVTYSTAAPCASLTGSVTVNVSHPVTGTYSVANKAICLGGNTSFTSVASAGATGLPLLHQWKVSTNGGASYTNVANGGFYTGATTSTLTITGATAALNGNLYRDSVYVTACSSFVLSAPGTLTVNQPPVLNIAAAPTTAVFPSLTTSVVVAVNPAPTNATTYVWTYNGSVLAGATTNTVTGIGVDALGTYSVKVTDGNGCSATSASITIRDSATTKLFIYPNPSNGQFHVRYHDVNTSPTFQGPRTLTIYDNKGARVYWKTYPITAPYADMFVDLSNHVKGIYTVDLTDFNGNRIKTGRVLIQ